jgi:hypothetical protein
MTAREMFENQLFNMEETSSEIIYTNGDIVKVLRECRNV